MSLLGNLIFENCTNPGTGAVNLGGAVTGRRSFAQAFATGTQCFYVLTDGTQSEWGIGVFTAGTPNTLSRATVLSNTAGTTSPLTFTGACNIYCDVPAERAPIFDANGYLLIGSGGPAATAVVEVQDTHNAITLRILQGFLNGTAQMIMQNYTGAMKFWVTSPNSDLSILNSSNTVLFNFASAGSAASLTGAWGTISDGTLKENIAPAASYTAKLRQLAVVKYSFIDQAAPKATMLGLIAQDVQKIMPGLVEETNHTKPDANGNPVLTDEPVLTVKTSILTFMLLQTVQELWTALEAVQARLAALESKA